MRQPATIRPAAMNDTVKWILAVFITAVAFYAGSDLLGFDWINFQASILAFVRMVGTLLLLFTGSAAAIEVARYYHRRNEEIDQQRAREHRGDSAESTPRRLAEAEEKVTRSDLEIMLKRAVSEAVREERGADEPAGEPATTDGVQRDRPAGRPERS